MNKSFLTLYYSLHQLLITSDVLRALGSLFFPHQVRDLWNHAHWAKCLQFIANTIVWLLPLSQFDSRKLLSHKASALCLRWWLKDMSCGRAPESHVMFSLTLAPCVCFPRQIMCKVVTMLGKDTVEHLLLPRFCNLCSDARLFQVRKVTDGTGRGRPLSSFSMQHAQGVFCISQQPPGPPSISNRSLNLFSPRVNSLGQHVSLNSVMHISLAHSVLLSCWGILIPCN